MLSFAPVVETVSVSKPSTLQVPLEQAEAQALLPVKGKSPVFSEEVIRRAAEGKAYYVEIIYRGLSPLLFGISLRYAGNREDAEDILQESFIKIFNNLSRFRHEGSFEGWARRITVNTALEFLRKKTLYFEEIDKSRGTPSKENIEDVLQAEELMELLRLMPDGYRTVFNLYVIEGFSHAEIAKMLGISEGTSKSQLSRAKEWIRQRLVNVYPERFSHLKNSNSDE